MIGPYPTVQMKLIIKLFVLQFIFARKFIFKCVQYITFISATDDDNYMQNTLINNIIFCRKSGVIII